MPYKDREKQLKYMREYDRARRKNGSKPKPKPKPKPTFTYPKFDILHILNKTLKGKLSYQEYKILHDIIWKY